MLLIIKIWNNIIIINRAIIIPRLGMSKKSISVVSANQTHNE